jgi:hypothetical protein
MAWIKSDQAIEKHPKTFDLMAAMGWDLDTTIAKLHRFWWWTLTYAEDGDLRKHPPARWCAAIGVDTKRADELFSALKKCKWIDTRPYIRVHDWWEHNGAFLRAKYNQRPELWQRVRELYTPVKRNASNRLSKRGQPNQTKPSCDTIRKDGEEESENRARQPSAPSALEHANGDGGKPKKVEGDGGGGLGDSGRLLELVSALQRAGIKGKKLFDLKGQRHLTAKIVNDEYADVLKSANVNDPTAVLITRLEQRARG